jgi:hypothetical protein
MTTPPRTLALAAVDPSAARRTVLRRRIRLLVAATITDNVIDAVIAIAADGTKGLRS